MKKSGKPDIVVFVAEDLDFEGLGCYDESRGGATAVIDAGNKKMGNLRMENIMTPTIDKLSSEGVQFNNYYCVSAICTPSRYSMVTGRMPERSLEFCEKYKGKHAVVWFDVSLQRNETNIFKTLSENGYKTSLFGKWHNFPEKDIDPNTPLYSALPKNSKWGDENVRETLEKGYNEAVAYLSEGFGIDHVDRLYANNPEPIIPRELSSHNIDWVVEGALEYMEENKKSTDPLFTYIAVSIPHSRYSDGEFKNFNPLASPKGMLEKRPESMPDREDIFRRVREAGLKNYAREGLWLDDAVNAVIEKLKETGRYENTCFVFTTDHPTCGKGTCNMGRIPLIIKWPGNADPGRQVEDMVSQTDFAPTLLDIAGCEIPKSMKVDGMSFKGILDKKSNYRREKVVMEVFNSRALVKGKYKYIANAFAADSNFTEEEIKQVGWHLPYPCRYKGELCPHWAVDSYFPHFFDKEQLYDTKKDPAEQNNLADNPEYSSILENMRDSLFSELESLPHEFDFCP